MPSGSETTSPFARRDTGTAHAERAAEEPPSRAGASRAAESELPTDAGETGRTGATRRARLGACVRRNWLATVLAALAGVALGFAFPPYGIWPLSLVAVAGLSLLTKVRREPVGVRARPVWRGAWLGFAFGWPFFLVLLKWLHPVGWDAVVGLAFLQGLFPAALGAALAGVARLPLWPLWSACLWVGEEFARDRLPFGGFPWGRLAFANTGSPYTPLAALGGAPLVTFGAALAGTALAALVLGGVRLARRRAQPGAGRRYVAAGGALVTLAAATGAGYAVPVHTAPDDSARIAVVQGNVQQAGMDFLGRPMKILNNHVNATLDLAKRVRAGSTPRPELVIWPENASDLDPYQWPEARARIDKAARAIGVPILIGALVDRPGDDGYVENQGIVWDPKKGAGASYTKQHPVPFGEYVPFREELSKVISRLERVPRDFYPGDHTGVLQVGPARLGDVICFEVAYDEIPRDTVNDGARALVVQTNNATYGNTGQPEQQLVMSKLRAVEHGRAVVTAATSGISAIVAPDGTVQQQTEEFTTDVLTADLPLRDEQTLADRVGAGPEWALAVLGGLSCVGAWVVGRRRRVRNEQAAPVGERREEQHR